MTCQVNAPNVECNYADDTVHKIEASATNQCNR